MRRRKRDPTWSPKSFKIASKFRHVVHTVFGCIFYQFLTPKSFSKPIWKRAKTICAGVIFYVVVLFSKSTREWTQACQCMTLKTLIFAVIYSSFEDFALCAQTSKRTSETDRNVLLFISKTSRKTITNDTGSKQNVVCRQAQFFLPYWAPKSLQNVPILEPKSQKKRDQNRTR